jgi:hypothetical protein
MEIVLHGVAANLPPVLGFNPDELAIFQLPEDGAQDYVLTLRNEADENGDQLHFKVSAEEIEEEAMRDAPVRGAHRVGPLATPRRDAPESIFAHFQDNAAWGGWLQQQVLDQVDGLEYDHFTSNQWDDFLENINDYDVLWVTNSEQPDAFNNAWNNAREAVEEWVDGWRLLLQYRYKPVQRRSCSPRWFALYTGWNIQWSSCCSG